MFPRKSSQTYMHLLLWSMLVIALGLWGTLAGPTWNPQPLSGALTPEMDDTSITTQTPSGKIGQYGVEKTLAQITLSDTQTITATIRRPRGYVGSAPAMLFVHGTGTQSHTAFYREADAIASTGIVTIVPDKRISDYSVTHRDYIKLADDYSEVFNYLLTLDGIDPQRAGIYAVSEGCFIAPIVAVNNPAVSYVALISAPVLPIRQQGAWAADTYLRTLGVPEKVLTAIPRLIGQEFSEGTFDYIDFDVSVYQRQITQPVFLAYGTGDISMPIVQASLILSDDLAEAANTPLTIRYYDKADHGLQVGDHILLLSAMQDVADWASGLPYTAHSSPSVAGAQPTQTYAADMVARTYWFASGKIGLYIPLIALLILFLSLIASALYSFIGILQRKTGRSGKEHLPVPIARMNIASIMLILALVGLLAYVFSVAYLATNYTHNVLITYGGWVVIRVLALVAAWLSLLAFSRFLHSYKSGGEYSWGTAPFAMVGVTFFGQLTLLMSLAYWGVFPSLI